MPLRNLSKILWRERQLIDLVERGSEERVALQLLELDRALTVNAVAKTFSLDPDVTLQGLAVKLPPPWSDVFRSLYDSLAETDVAVLPRSLADFLR